jgi:hypothetical protein
VKELRAPEIAKRLGVSRQYAARVIKTIPGAFCARVTPLFGREVWKVDERAFELWKAGFRFPQLTNGTGIAK